VYDRDVEHRVHGASGDRTSNELCHDSGIDERRNGGQHSVVKFRVGDKAGTVDWISCPELNLVQITTAVQRDVERGCQFPGKSTFEKGGRKSTCGSRVDYISPWQYMHADRVEAVVSNRVWADRPVTAAKLSATETLRDGESEPEVLLSILCQLT
jgi:hypothetical protein